MEDDAQVFEAHRDTLLVHAYRMLGDMGRAEDIVQEAWLRWARREAVVEIPKAYLLKVVTNLCLNELDSAHVRHEHARGDRLPEPVSFGDAAIARFESFDQISMAFLVLLQRLTPAERVTLLLHDVFDFSHAEVAEFLAKSEPACRQLLKRARQHVASERRQLSATREQHQQALQQFVRAATSGDVNGLLALLAADATLVADAGPDGGSFGGARNVSAPIVGAHKVAAFVAAVTPRAAAGLITQQTEANGLPALVVHRDGRRHSVIAIAMTGSMIQSVFIHADASRLDHVH